MILIYSQLPFNKKEIHKQIDLLKDRLFVFFIDDNFFLFSTESNQKLLRELIINHEISLFYTNSINQMKFTPTEVCELIIFLLKNNCSFQSELDNLFFTNDNIDIVYPTIFDLFKNKHNK